MVLQSHILHLVVMADVLENVLLLVEEVVVLVNVRVIVAQAVLVNVLMPVNMLALKLVEQIVQEGLFNGKI